MRNIYIVQSMCHFRVNPSEQFDFKNTVAFIVKTGIFKYRDKISVFFIALDLVNFCALFSKVLLNKFNEKVQNALLRPFLKRAISCRNLKKLELPVW